MLVLKLSLGNITTAYRDVTDATGAYNASTNTGGYGTPNLARADANVLLLATHKKSSGNQALDVDITTPNGADPSNVTGWRVNLEGDGYIKYALISAPDYNIAIVYNRYDIIFNTSDGYFYYYDNSVASTPGTFSTSNGWKLLTDADIVDKSTQDSDDGFYKVVVSDFVNVNSRLCISKRAVDYVKNDECEDCIEEALKDSFKIQTYLSAAESLASVGNYIKAQVIAEKISELCGTGSTSCGC
jgi:hypothetical protein